MNTSLRAPLLVLAGIVAGFCANAALTALRAPAPAPEAASAAIPESSVGGPAAPTDLASASGTKVKVSAEAFDRGQRAVAEHPKELMEQIAGVASAGERLDFIRGVFTALAHDYPDYALELVAELTDPREKSTAMRALALEWAFDESIDTGEGLKSAVLGATLALAATNPAKATLLATSQLDGRERGFALMATASRWAEMDPAAAVEWAAGLPQDQQQGMVMVQVATAAADREPSLAASLVSKLGDGRARGWAVSQVASKWFDQDPNAAVAWTSTLTDSGEQSRAIGSIASKWADTDPAGAVEWAGQIESADLQKSASSAAIGSWARKDPAAAAAYATSLPTGELKTASVESVASGWARTDRDAALAWAQTLPEADLRDAATKAANRRGRGRNFMP